MTRGNQREVDRQRAQKKQEEKLKAAGRVSSIAIVICSYTVF
jgi:4F5 protein related disordered region